jgi:hypothetical protein
VVTLAVRVDCGKVTCDRCAYVSILGQNHCSLLTQLLAFGDDGRLRRCPACARLGRRFIGIEIEPRYFDIACERIRREYEQLKLFPPEEKRTPAVQPELLARQTSGDAAGGGV